MRAQRLAPAVLAAAMVLLAAPVAAQGGDGLPGAPSAGEVESLLALCEFVAGGCPDLTVTLNEDCLGFNAAEVCQERFVRVAVESGALVLTGGECVDAFGTRNCIQLDREVLEPEDLAVEQNVTVPTTEAGLDALAEAVGVAPEDLDLPATPAAPALPLNESLVEEGGAVAPGDLTAEDLELLLRGLVASLGLAPEDPTEVLLGNLTAEE